MTQKNNRPTLRAEWEPHGAVLLAWPHSKTDWAYMLGEVQECYRQIIAAILQAGEKVALLTPAAEDPKIEGVTTIYVNTNDTWIRDYGPLTIGVDTLLDFRFNGWGQKFASNFDNQVNRELYRMGVYEHEPLCHKDLVLEGGSIESDGQGTILTTACCLTAPNRNEPLTRTDMEREMLQRLGADKVLWLEHGSLSGDDTDGHIDTLCRLAPGNSIVYTGCQDPADEHFAELSAMTNELHELTNAKGEHFNLVELPLPDPIIDPEEGIRLPATYANYLVLERAVLLPVYGQPLKDQWATMALGVVYPDREIIPVDCRPLIRQHGSLHCATMQIPLTAINI